MKKKYLRTAIDADNLAMTSKGERSRRWHRKAQIYATLATLEQARPDPQNLVREFHSMFRQPMRDTPSISDAQRAMHRQQWLEEEVQELRDAIVGIDGPDIVEVSDALADILYIVYGTAVEFGIDLGSIFEEVHASNMRKLDENGNPIIREDGKIMKPEGWVPPQIAPIIAAQQSVI